MHDILKVIPLISICLISDVVLATSNLPTILIFNKKYLKALCDNLGHGMVAVSTWMLVIDYNFCSKTNICLTILCGVLGCSIDVDHFLAAKSINLTNALKLTTRPPLHNTSVIAFLLPIHGWLWFVRPSSPSTAFLHDVLLTMWTAIISHHLRDAHRRGLWFWPVGSTPPVRPNFLYIGLILMTAYVLKTVRQNVNARLSLYKLSLKNDVESI